VSTLLFINGVVGGGRGGEVCAKVSLMASEVVNYQRII